MNMGVLLSLFGSALLLLLTISALLFMAAPTLGKRMLQNTTAFAGVFLVVLFALGFACQVLRSINQFLVLLGLGAVSTVAYLIRERRLKGPGGADRPRHTERTPVMPSHIGRDEE